MGVLPASFLPQVAAARGRPAQNQILPTLFLSLIFWPLKANKKTNLFFAFQFSAFSNLFYFLLMQRICDILKSLIERQFLKIHSLQIFQFCCSWKIPTLVFGLLIQEQIYQILSVTEDRPRESETKPGWAGAPPASPPHPTLNLGTHPGGYEDDID